MKKVLFLALISVSLIACGQTGPLVLPEEPSAKPETEQQAKKP